MSATAGRRPPGLSSRVRPGGLGSRLRGQDMLWMGVGIIVLCTLVAVVGSQLYGVDPSDRLLVNRLQPPGTDGHLLGTDSQGRDVLARVLAAFPWSLSVGAVATLICALLGTALGVGAAAVKGFGRLALTSLIDMLIAFPFLVMAVVVVVLVGRGWVPLVVTLGVIVAPLFARIVYGEALSAFESDYVTAAFLSGRSLVSVVVRHVLPALRPTLGVIVAFTFADLIIAESALAFLGLGAPRGEPSWGRMLAEGREHLTNAPWLVYVPGAFIALLVIAANLVGDGLAQRERVRSKGLQ